MPECPRCAAPLYRLSSPEPKPPRDLDRSARSRPRSRIPDPRRASVEAAADEELPTPVAYTPHGRWAVIVLALVLAGTSFAFAMIRVARPDLVAAVGREGVRTDPEAPPLASPRPAATQPGQPGPCSTDGSRVELLTQPQAVTVPAATADYRFQGSLGSRVGAAPDLVEIGDGISAFTDEGMIGRAVLSFARGTGLSLSPTNGVIDGTEYTIEVLFRFDRLDGYRKIIDFKDGSDDDGLYVLDGCLNFYPRRPRSSSPIEADSYVQVVLTRDPSARVVGYVDGIRRFAFRDTAALAEIASETLRFFVDDSVTGGDEYSSGAVSQIRLFDRPLTANEVAALACAEIRVPLATHLCPDPR
jgi:Concanavalin A-like lectin/glucanases superfamily